MVLTFQLCKEDLVAIVRRLRTAAATTQMRSLSPDFLWRWARGYMGSLLPETGWRAALGVQ